MNYVCIQIARRINVAEDDWKSFRRRELLCTNVSRSETIATVTSSWAQVDGVWHLEVIAQAFIEHQFRTIEEHRHHV